MKITLDLTKSANENAQSYFEKAKRAKKKLKGVLETRQRMLIQLAKEKKNQEKAITKNTPKVVRKREWFEKFRWSYLTSEKLAIGGRDATTNEIAVKKHMIPQDKVLHTDMAGSPFFVIQSEKKEITEQDISETALLCACYSRAWQRKLNTVEVFVADPEQISKKAESGEFIGKGAFMVRGKVDYHHPKLVLGISKYKDFAIAGHPELLKQKYGKVIVVVPGDKKTSDTAKFIAKSLEINDVDDVLRILPTGGHTIIPFEQLSWYL